jgi:hypothetical protein
VTNQLRTFLLTFCFCVHAAAQTHQPVQLVFPKCDSPPIAPGELEQALLVELQASGFESAAGEGPRVVLEYPECRLDATDLKITIDFTVPSHTNASLHTRLTLSDVPPTGRARTVAVAVTELVRVARPPTLPATATPLPPPPPTEPSHSLPPLAPSPRAQAPRHGRLSVGASAQVALLASGGDAFLGGEALMALDVASRWRPRLSLAASHNSVKSGFGPIDFTVYRATLGWDWLFSTRPIVAIGPELSLAGVRAQGHSNLGVTETTQTRNFSSGGARIALEVPLYGALRLAGTANIGYVLQPVLFTAGGEDAAKFTGVQGGWTVGFLFQP